MKAMNALNDADQEEKVFMKEMKASNDAKSRRKGLHEWNENPKRCRLKKKRSS